MSAALTTLPSIARLSGVTTTLAAPSVSRSPLNWDFTSALAVARLPRTAGTVETPLSVAVNAPRATNQSVGEEVFTASSPDHSRANASREASAAESAKIARTSLSFAPPTRTM